MCIREPDFVAMYENLGDFDRQQRIRESSPGGPKHCHFLVQSSRACECLPDLAGDQAGQPCPNNPYSRHRSEYAKLGEYGMLVSEAHWIGNRIELELLESLDELGADEFQAACIMRRHIEQQREARKAKQQGMTTDG